MPTSKIKVVGYLRKMVCPNEQTIFLSIKR